MDSPVKNFTYLKEGGPEQYEVLQIKDLGTSIEGISFKGLTDAQKTELMVAHSKWLEVLGPYMKNYRKFIKDKMVEQNK